jgi:short-subunit dehydrogenase
MASLLRNGGRRVWLTGASSGIGRSLLELLVQQGNQVIITSRNLDELELLRQRNPEQINVLVADISVPDSAKSMASSLRKITGTLDTVILNAGTCEYVDINNFKADLFDRVLQANFLGTVRCIEASLELLKSGENPHLVGLSSAAAFTGLPRAEAYGASKVAIGSLFESLSLDLSSHAVDVSIVYPGFVDTPLTRRNDFAMPFMMTPEKAAKLIVKGLDRRRLKIAFPGRLTWPLRAMSVLPARLRQIVGVGMVRKQGEQI